MGSNKSRANYRVELHSQIFFSSLPNIFITINPCDLHHPLAMKFAGVDLNIDNLIVDLMPKSQQRAAIIASHPIGIVRFFNKLITTVLSTLINYNINKHKSNPGGGVLGEIEAYHDKVEESGRGALHLHMLLWLVNNKHPHELRNLIVNELPDFNTYIHKFSAIWPTSNNPSCRLRYPKKLHDPTTINVENGEIQMKHAHSMMNNFNEWLLLACRCYMDIKFIWSASDTKALVYYISDYITKKNLSFHDSNSLIYQVVQKFEKNEQKINYIDALDKSRRLILRCFNTLASQQEISSVQVASYLMG
ncbi:unnamed protein product [Rotaria sp. Silwood2]|nr:unnamed protein product [Rotaria sp. Silwood2]CAF4251955.1 unnamed protein product [Rotaria sp. Silwood2]